ncbi:MAG: transcriptional regulator [Candidatus Andersenbacteria bacterium CG10_big_fil_rev_8_21_14_0_10_54_11]|uniref:Transcriptional regulator n=1 Tax=Candidatus Andersenbacteria bacterium CG10_big_fil_rev_8_21_14_0_10_54_11 TaxID=1974485 RepID=A0A2M6WYR6_9BACT|nr:MAG: transcriptional regulator [Candidatus Andersenbacteria bacterium CG10_big_fil_rev_8_21_14_0_10_54_11]
MVKHDGRALAQSQGVLLDRIFVSLSDQTRRHILRRLAKRPLTVSEIAAPYAVSLPAISKHLTVLEQAQLVRRKKRGRERVVYLRPQTLQTAAKHIAYYQKFWRAHLDALQAYLEGGDL